MLQDIGKSNKATSNKLPPEPKRVSAGLPRRILDATMKENCAYLAWLESRFGSARGAQTLQTMLITTMLITTISYPFLPNTPTNGGCGLGR